jgi:hypothetical protein
MEQIAALLILALVAVVFFIVLNPNKLVWRLYSSSLESLTVPRVSEQNQKPRLLVKPFALDRIPPELRGVVEGELSYADLLDTIRKTGGVSAWFQQQLCDALEEAGTDVVECDSKAVPPGRFLLQGELMNVVRSRDEGKIAFKARLTVGNSQLLSKTYVVTSNRRNNRSLLGSLSEQWIGPSRLDRSNPLAQRLLDEALHDGLQQLTRDLSRALPYLQPVEAGQS